MKPYEFWFASIWLLVAGLHFGGDWLVYLSAGCAAAALWGSYRALARKGGVPDANPHDDLGTS